MMKNVDIKNLDRLYQDCLNTSGLWLNNDVLDLQQITLVHQKHVFKDNTNQRLRLGKLVERFICYYLELDSHIKVLTKNVQIKSNKITIGELDCLLLQNDNPIHLEIVYKFYLFDASIGHSELDHWIGPNKKDSLVQKLKKLKEKQLPLLYSNYTKPLLDKHQLKAKTIAQMVCFKAQLFVPFESKTVQFELINKDCVAGFYIKKNQLEQFAECVFYIPEKIDWILNLNVEVPWINYLEFSNTINSLLEKEKAPLCWIKNTNGDLSKCFVVWW